jgi:tripartite-type tricarboxylate transporter receptor subunit TctC
MNYNARNTLFATLLASLALPAAAADTYPTRPIRLVVPFGPGGGTDINARILAEPISSRLGQTVVVDNRPGAGSILGTEIVTNANPDGHTLLISTISMAFNFAIFKKLPFDLKRDLIPISLVANQPNIIVAHPSLPAKSFKEFVALARSQPGKLTFGSAGVGTGTQMAMVLLMMQLKADMVHVPYKGTGPALTALLGNQISVYLSTFASALPHVKADRLRAYAVTTAKRASPLPDVPTVGESGVPGYEYATWYGMLAPAGTPRPVVNTINQALVASLNSTEVKTTYANQGLNPTPTTPAEFSRYFASEIDKWVGVVRAAKIPQR